MTAENDIQPECPVENCKVYGKPINALNTHFLEKHSDYRLIPELPLFFQSGGIWNIVQRSPFCYLNINDHVLKKGRELGHWQWIYMWRSSCAKERSQCSTAVNERSTNCCTHAVMLISVLYLKNSLPEKKMSNIGLPDVDATCESVLVHIWRLKNYWESQY